MPRYLCRLGRWRPWPGKRCSAPPGRAGLRLTAHVRDLLRRRRRHVSSHRLSRIPRGGVVVLALAVVALAAALAPAATQPKPARYVGAATKAAASTRALEVARPGGVGAGDLMLAAIELRQASGRGVSAPEGWRLIRRDRARRGHSSLAQALYSKVCRHAGAVALPVAIRQRHSRPGRDRRLPRGRRSLADRLVERPCLPERQLDPCSFASPDAGRDPSRRVLRAYRRSCDQAAGRAEGAARPPRRQPESSRAAGGRRQLRRCQCERSQKRHRQGPAAPGDRSAGRAPFGNHRHTPAPRTLQRREGTDQVRPRGLDRVREPLLPPDHRLVVGPVLQPARPQVRPRDERHRAPTPVPAELHRPDLRLHPGHHRRRVAEQASAQRALDLQPAPVRRLEVAARVDARQLRPRQLGPVCGQAQP